MSWGSLDQGAQSFSFLGAWVRAGCWIFWIIVVLNVFPSSQYIHPFPICFPTCSKSHLTSSLWRYNARCCKLNRLVIIQVSTTFQYLRINIWDLTLHENCHVILYIKANMVFVSPSLCLCGQKLGSAWKILPVTAHSLWIYINSDRSARQKDLGNFRIWFSGLGISTLGPGKF
jgi:hypothetical protein